jgi:hypothetical protein
MIHPSPWLWVPMLFVFASVFLSSTAEERDLADEIRTCDKLCEDDYVKARDRILKNQGLIAYLSKTDKTSSQGLLHKILVIRASHVDKCADFDKWFSSTFSVDIRDSNPVSAVNGKGLDGILIGRYGDKAIHNAFDFTWMGLLHRHNLFDGNSSEKYYGGRDVYYLAAEAVFKRTVHMSEECIYTIVRTLFNIIELSHKEAQQDKSAEERALFNRLIVNEFVGSLSEKSLWRRIAGLEACNYIGVEDGKYYKIFEDSLADDAIPVRITALRNLYAFRKTDPGDIERLLFRWMAKENVAGIKCEAPRIMRDLLGNKCKPLLERMRMKESNEDVLKQIKEQFDALKE